LILNKYGNELIFESELSEKTITEISGGNTFFHDVITSWSAANTIYKSRHSQKRIKKEIIWNNKSITANGKTLFYRDWYDRGIKYIYQLFDFRNKTMYNFENIKYLYDINNNDFMKFNTLITSIPKEYKTEESIHDLDINQPDETLSKAIIKTKYPNKFIYNIQLQNEDNDILENKWNTNFTDIDSTTWKKIHIVPHISTIDMSLRSFQYKFIMRIVPTNTYLFKCKLSNSTLCDFCQSHIETIDHLFWECQHIQIIWKKMETFLASKNILIEINKTHAFFGCTEKKLHSDVFNFIVILLKSFIFKMKYKKCIPTFPHFIEYLNTRIKIESEIALVKNKYEQHQKNGFNSGDSYILQTINNAIQTNFMAKQLKQKKILLKTKTNTNNNSIETNLVVKYFLYFF